MEGCCWPYLWKPIWSSLRLYLYLSPLSSTIANYFYKLLIFRLYWLNCVLLFHHQPSVQTLRGCQSSLVCYFYLAIDITFFWCLGERLVLLIIYAVQSPHQTPPWCFAFTRTLNLFYFCFLLIIYVMKYFWRWRCVYSLTSSYNFQCEFFVNLVVLLLRITWSRFRIKL